MKTDKIQEFKDKDKMKDLKSRLSEFVANITNAKSSISGLRYDDKTSDVISKIIECQELETRAVVDSCIAAVRMTQADEEAARIPHVTGSARTKAENRRDTFAAEAIHLADEAKALRDALDKLPDEYKNDILKEPVEYTDKEIEEQNIEIKEEKDRWKEEKVVADRDRLLAEIDDNIKIIRENQSRFSTSETIEKLKEFNKLLRSAKVLIDDGTADNLDKANRIMAAAQDRLLSEELHNNTTAKKEYDQYMLNLAIARVNDAELQHRLNTKKANEAITKASHLVDRLEKDDTAHSAELAGLRKRLNILLGVEEPTTPGTEAPETAPETPADKTPPASEGTGAHKEDDRKTRFDLTTQLKAARYSIEEEGTKPEMYRKLIERIHTVAETKGYEDIKEEAERVLRIIEDHALEEKRKAAAEESENAMKKGEYLDAIKRFMGAVERGEHLEEARSMALVAIGFADGHGYADLEAQANRLLEMVSEKSREKKEETPAEKEETPAEKEETLAEDEGPMDISFGQDAEKLIQEATTALAIGDDKKALEKADAALRIAKLKGLDSIEEKAKMIIKHVQQEPRTEPEKKKSGPGEKKEPEKGRRERTTKPGGWDAPESKAELDAEKKAYRKQIGKMKEKANTDPAFAIAAADELLETIEGREDLDDIRSEIEEIKQDISSDMERAKRRSEIEDVQVLSRLQRALRRGEFVEAADLADEAKKVVDSGVDTEKTDIYLRNIDVAKSIARASELYAEGELAESIGIIEDVEKKYRSDNFVREIIRRWFDMNIESADEDYKASLTRVKNRMRL